MNDQQQNQNRFESTTMQVGVTVTLSLDEAQKLYAALSSTAMLAGVRCPGQPEGKE